MLHLGLVNDSLRDTSLRTHEITVTGVERLRSTFEAEAQTDIKIALELHHRHVLQCSLNPQDMPCTKGLYSDPEA